MSTARTSFPEISQQVRDLLDEKQAAALLTVEPGTLSVWRSTGRYKIPFVKIGHLVRYRRTDLESWLESRVRESGATA
jgi:excisionase family DNA binding protein